MSRQFVIDGGYVNEFGARVYLTDGGYFNDKTAAAAGGGTEGYALGTLNALTNISTGFAGASGYELGTFQALTNLSTGTVQVDAAGFSLNTLQALTNLSTGITGALGNALGTLQALTGSGGGSALVAGTDGYGLGTFNALTNIATGRTGAVGYSFNTLNALTGTSGGTNSSPPAVDVAPFRGGRAWWGYESFDGSRKPWWYKDLRDKAKELEKLRAMREEIGLLTRAEDKEMSQAVAQVEAFIQEMPTPETANRYIAKATRLAEKIEILVENLEEMDDEEAIIRASRFFFNHRGTLSCLMH